MGLLASFILPRKVLASLFSEVDHLRERVNRLEIAQREDRMAMESVSEAQHRLMKRAAGRAGGRPVRDDSERQALDSIARGDKAALRAHFAPELAARQRGQIPLE